MTAVVQPMLRRNLPSDEIAALASRNKDTLSLAQAMYSYVEMEDEWVYISDERKSQYLELAQHVIDKGTPPPLEEFVLINPKTSVEEGRHFTLIEARDARVDGQEIWRTLDRELDEPFAP